MSTPATTDLSDLVEALKRDVAVPGNFDSVFPNTEDPDLVLTLEDGLAQAQLDGFFSDLELDLNTHVTTPGLSPASQRVVILYSSEIISKNQLTALAERKRYKAGPTEYETSTYATVLQERLKDIRAAKQALLDQLLKLGRGANSTQTIDGYWTRALGLEYPVW